MVPSLWSACCSEPLTGRARCERICQQWLVVVPHHFLDRLSPMKGVVDEWAAARRPR